MNCPSLVLASLCLLLLVVVPAADAQQDFTTAQVPTFSRGVFYPARFPVALEAEVATCRAITDRIDRDSARFNSELVTNTNNGIHFSTADSRLMSSRMQSRLDDLAEAYFADSGRRVTVVKAWTPFPDRDLSAEDESLHYEGTCDCIAKQFWCGIIQLHLDCKNYIHFLKIHIVSHTHLMFVA